MSSSTALCIRTPPRFSRMHTSYLVFNIDFRYPPALVCVLGTDAQPFPLTTRIVDVPPIALVFGWFGLIAKGEQLIQAPYLARERTDTFVYITRLLLVGEEEGEEGEVATSYADRGLLLAQHGRTRFKTAVRYHGIRYPYFLLSYGFGVWRSVWRRAGQVTEDDVVRHEVECALETRSPAHEADIFYLGGVSRMILRHRATPGRLPCSRVCAPLRGDGQALGACG